jgi:hypothetical protein
MKSMVKCEKTGCFAVRVPGMSHDANIMQPYSPPAERMMVEVGGGKLASLQKIPSWKTIPRPICNSTPSS